MRGTGGCYWRKFTEKKKTHERRSVYLVCDWVSFLGPVLKEVQRAEAAVQVDRSLAREISGLLSRKRLARLLVCVVKRMCVGGARMSGGVLQMVSVKSRITSRGKFVSICDYDGALNKQRACRTEIGVPCEQKSYTIEEFRFEKKC